VRDETAFFGLQKAGWLSGASLLALVFVSGPVPGAQAQERYYYTQQGQYQRLQGPPPRIENRRDARRRPNARPTAQAPKQMPKQAEKAAPPPSGPHLLIVSVKSQKVSFYANGKLTSQSPVSTGTATHPTPHGVFSIIQRNRHHRSNIYSGAPMPYMQRLTWSGVALHQGALPGYPASHGCIRLPEQYANYLWGAIKMNTRVIVSRDDIAPFDVAHAMLFQPKPAAATVQSVPELRKTLDTTQIRVRTANVSVIATDGAAERVDGEDARSAETAKPDLATSKPVRDLSSSVERAQDEVKTDVAAPAQTDQPAKSEIAAPLQPGMPTKPELAGQEPAKEPESTASIYPQPANIPEPILASFAQSLEAKQKKAAPSGTVTVFISKKDKRLYVRQHFIPLFSAPVTFKDDKPNFGTHVFTALEKDGGDKELRWIAITMPAELPKAQKVKTRIEYDRRGRPIEVPVKAQGKAPEPLTSLNATAVLDRIEIAPEIVDRISEYVTPGASLIVSDHGLGYETGLYTDFIVVTQK
jgi:lipoprotein-anchoring transpeptidase ErfK/SrfK